MIRHRLNLIIPAFLLGFWVSATAQTVHLKAVLADTAFPASGTYRMEVLETGDTLRVHPGVNFSFLLPSDSLWTLCARRGDSSGSFEKCFEVHRPGSDPIIEASLEGSGVTLAQPEIQNTAATNSASADTTNAVANGPAGEAENEAVRLQKVVLRAQRIPKRALGRQTISAKLIKRMPGLAEADVIRSIQALPGVVASSDFSTKIYVRGGGSDQNLILFDNAPVYSPVHFFGLFSTFLVDGIKDVNFYDGGFAPEYGNRLSSVLDIASRHGGEDTANSIFKGSSINISSVATTAHTEGHEGNFSWLLAARATYIKEVVDLLRHLGAIDLNLDYYFYDVQGNVAYSPNKNTEAMLSLYQGRDNLNFDPIAIDWGNTIIPFNFKWKPADDWTSNSTLSYSLLSQDFGLQGLFGFYNKIITYQAKQRMEYSGLENQRLSFGAEANVMQTVFGDNESASKTDRTDKTNFFIGSIFAQDKWSPGQWEFSPGLRLNYLSTLEKVYGEPRMSIKYSLPDQQSLDFHVGYYMQYINAILFSNQETINEFYYPAKNATYHTVNPSSSVLFATGYSKDAILGQYDFSLQGYYKTLNHLPIFAPNEKPDSVANASNTQLGDLFDEAQGYSYGLEISLRRPLGVLSGGASYSRGYSVIKEATYTTPYYPNWYQPNSFKGDLAINWKGADGIWPEKIKGRYFRSSMQLKFASGLPYTQDAGYVPAHQIDQGNGGDGFGGGGDFNDNVDVISSGYNDAFYPNYFRWDLKAVDWGTEGKWNFSFTILNITNHKNVFLYTYSNANNPPKLITIPQFPFFPFLLSYEYTF